MTKNKWLGLVLFGLICLIVMATTSSADSRTDYLYPVKIGNLYGYIDNTGKQVIAAKFQDAHDFYDGYGAVKQKGKWWFINRKGRFLNTKPYAQVRDFSESRAAVYDGKHWGFIDTRGKVVVPLKYVDVDSYSEGLAFIREFKGFIDDEYKSSWGFIDPQGKIAILLEAQSSWDWIRLVSPFQDGVARFEHIRHRDSDIVTIDKNGKELERLSFLKYPDWDLDLDKTLCPLPTEEASDQKMMLGRYEGDTIKILASDLPIGKCGYIDKTGSWIIKPAFKEAWRFRDGYAAFMKEGAYHYFDGYGQNVFNKIGFINRSGEVVLPAEDRVFNGEPEAIDGKISDFEEGCLVYKDMTGKITDDPDYPSLKPVYDANGASLLDLASRKSILIPDCKTIQKSNGLIIAGNGKLFGLYSKNGEKLTDYIYQSVEPLAKGRAIVKKEGKYGLIDADLQMLMPLSYEILHACNDWQGLIFKIQGKYGLAQYDGKIVAKNLPGYPKGFGSGLVLYYDHGKFGYAAADGHIVLPAKYSEAIPFKGAYAEVTEKGKKKVIDKNGKQKAIKLPEFRGMLGEGETEALVFIDKGKLGLLDESGRKLTLPIYEEISNFRDGYAKVKKDGRYGYIDMEGKLRVQCKFESLGNYSENLASFKKDDKYGFIDRQGITVIPAVYAYVGEFSEGLCTARTGPGTAKAGLMDREGQYIIPPEYEDVKFFSEGMAAVKADGLWGYVGSDSKIVIRPAYAYAEDFRGGIAKVWFDTDKEKMGYINKGGKVIWKGK